MTVTKYQKIYSFYEDCQACAEGGLCGIRSSWFKLQMVIEEVSNFCSFENWFVPHGMKLSIGILFFYLRSGKLQRQEFSLGQVCYLLNLKILRRKDTNDNQ